MIKTPFEFIFYKLYGILNRGINIWLENNSVKVFVPEEVVFTKKDEKFIKFYKKKIIDILKNNNV